MDLRSGQPYWLIKNGPLASYPPLERRQTCEVAIIGGGITGALVAHRLVGEGVETVLVDKREVAMGSTAASTALLQYATDKSIVMIEAVPYQRFRFPFPQGGANLEAGRGSSGRGGDGVSPSSGGRGPHRRRRAARTSVPRRRARHRPWSAGR
jgi:glycine/D-amino acid oxidase-like deaminating enzyme